MKSLLGKSFLFSLIANAVIVIVFLALINLFDALMEPTAAGQLFWYPALYVVCSILCVLQMLRVGSVWDGILGDGLFWKVPVGMIAGSGGAIWLGSYLLAQGIVAPFGAMALINVVMVLLIALMTHLWWVSSEARSGQITA